MRKRYKIENWTECIWMKLCNYCTWRVAQWWKHSPPPMWSGVNAICGLSLVLVLSFTLRGFCWVLQFSLPLKIKQHSQTPIWLKNVRQRTLHGCATHCTFKLLFIYLLILLWLWTWFLVGCLSHLSLLCWPLNYQTFVYNAKWRIKIPKEKHQKKFKNNAKLKRGS